MAFAHLHVHTEYSLLDGAARIKDIMTQAKKHGMSSVAITDHGNMFGVYEFYKAANEAGIHPVIGCEVYMATRSRHDKDSVKDKEQAHLVLLAKNNKGYKNLIKLASLSYTEGFYYKPRVDKEILSQHSEGLIALSACLAGNIPRKLAVDDYAGAKEEAIELLEMFGEGNFYLELQNHMMPEQAKILPGLEKLHEETGIPFVATNDVHYVKREHAESHDALLCIQTGKIVSDVDRMKFPNDEFYFKSEKEMLELFPDYPEAVSNTQMVADMCNVHIKKGKYLPEFTPPEGKTVQEHLRELTYAGLHKRYGEVLSEEQETRAEMELGVIESMGFVNYFLIVWDFIRYAKDNDIPVGPGRGSGAGSIVAYALGITDIDPLKYGLIFERFLNPERVSMPDFDVDFCKDRRDEVIQYVLDKYGVDNVAKIATFNTLASKAAVRDVGRVLGMPYGDVDKIAKLIPMALQGEKVGPASLEKALARTPELKKAREDDAQIDKLFKIALDLEGLSRNTGTHAAGVVIAKQRIDECVPLFVSDKTGVSTQFTMTEVEELGLLKMDFLGLRTLTVIQGAIDMIKKNHRIDIDFSNDNYDDPKVYEMISAGNNDGVFQLESAGMSNFFTQLVPTCLEDVIAGIALYRPGPMDHIPEYVRNRKDPSKVKYLTKELETSLKETDGVMIYQEQAMQIVRDLAGFSMGRSDEVRRFMSKKKLDKMEQERKVFINGEQDAEGNYIVPGCVRNGINAKVANEIFDNLTSFASYAFNKSHAAVYAILSYRTAYLKFYYPREFMASIMSSFIGERLDQITRYIRNCKQMGIEVLPPDVLESDIKFSVVDGKIRIGLQVVKSVGMAAEAIINSRDSNNKPTSMFEFLKSIDLEKINKKAIESLIKVGAFDCFDTNRAKHLSVYELMLETIKSDKKNVHGGQMSLGELAPDVMESADLNIDLPDIADVSQGDKLEWEKELIGVYVSGHPLDRYSLVIDKIKKDESSYVTTDMIANPEENPQMRDNMKVCVVGFISDIRTTQTKAGETMAFLEIEDYFGSVGAVIFSEMYKNNIEIIGNGEPVILRGILQYREDKDPSIRTMKISSLDVAVKYYFNK